MTIWQTTMSMFWWKLNTGITKKAHSEKHCKRCEKKSEEISRCSENWVLGYQDHRADGCYFYIYLQQNLMLHNIWPPSLLNVCDQTPFTFFKGQLVGERYRNHGTDRSGCKDSVWSFIATASSKGLKAPCSLMVELTAIGTAPSFYTRDHPKYQPKTWLVHFEFLL